MRKVFNRFIMVIGLLLICYAAFNIVLFIVYPQPNLLSYWNLRGSNDQLESLAEIAAFAAVGFWATKKAYTMLKKQGIQEAVFIKPFFQLFQKHHVLIGWVVLLTTSAHGLYYILHKTDRENMMITGWLAWSGLIVLAFVGVFFDHRIKSRKQTKRIRFYHIGFSLVFLVGFVLHVL